MAIFYFILTIILNSAANILLKISSKHGLQFKGLNFWQMIAANYLVIIGLASFALSAVFYFLSLRALPLSVVYPMLVGLAFILINIFAVFFLGEKIVPVQIFGYLFLLTGVILITYFNVNK